MLVFAELRHGLRQPLRWRQMHLHSTASVQKVNMYRAHAAQFSTQSAQLPLDSRREQICTTSNVFRPVKRKNYRDTLDITSYLKYCVPAV